MNCCQDLKYCVGWVSCSLRMPRKGARVLVSLKNDRLDVDTYKGFPLVGDYAFYKHNEVVAWQELPMPYKGR